jgi:hypothetical protein
MRNRGMLAIWAEMGASHAARMRDLVCIMAVINRTLGANSFILTLHGVKRSRESRTQLAPLDDLMLRTSARVTADIACAACIE